MKNILISILIIAVSFSTKAFATCDEGERVIRFSLATALEGHPKGEAALAISERINEEMNGKACMRIFYNSELFNDEEVFAAILNGKAEIAAPSVAMFAPYTKKYQLFDLPFMFPDMDGVNRFSNNKKGQELLQAMNDEGFTGLSFIYNGFKQFSANKPLITPADAKGLTIRIQQNSNVSASMVKAIRAIPKETTFAELYDVLETKGADGQENTWSNIYANKFHEVQDSITETNHQVLTYVAITSSKWLATLPEDERKKIQQIFTEESSIANSNANEINKANKQKILDAGVTINELNRSQRQAWIRAMKPVWDLYREEIGEATITAAIASGI